MTATDYILRQAERNVDEAGALYRTKLEWLDRLVGEAVGEYQRDGTVGSLDLNIGNVGSEVAAAARQLKVSREHLRQVREAIEFA